MKAKGEFVSIYIQLVRLLVMAAIMAGCLFLVQHKSSDYLISNYIYTQDYEEKRNLMYVGSLQDYISDNSLKISDCPKISEWVKKQKLLSISIYQNHKQIFNSYYPDKDYLASDYEYPEYEWEKYYDLHFTDGDAYISLVGRYDYQLYNYTLVLEIIVSFICFTIIIILGIRKKIIYIRMLSEQISILENGGLEYEITVRGKDELAMLADGLQKMRISFKSMIEHETELLKQNKKNISEMSHDLRTPVTAILLFIEIIKKEKYGNNVYVREYIDKIEQRALNMKQLTTNLFRYSLDFDKADNSEYTEIMLKDVFFDRLSEFLQYLKNNDILWKTLLKWSDNRIQVKAEYIDRILDNIASNIIKYADREIQVEIYTLNREEYEGIGFCNNISCSDYSNESYGVGVQSITNMMKAMGGKCEVRQSDDKYSIEILFPIKTMDMFRGTENEADKNSGRMDRKCKQ